MHILFCNERFLFRFGVDRVLLILAKGLKERGHGITFMANRFDEEILSHISPRVISVPKAPEYLESNEFTEEWIKSNWDCVFPVEEEPDLVIIGGWPFVSIIPFFEEKGVKVIFSDHGVVPLEGYSDYHLQVLKKLKNLRSKYLRHASAVIGVSNFIVNSQSREDTGGEVPLYAVLNGANHMEIGLWMKDQVKSGKGGGALKTVQRLQKAGKALLLNLGRWEPGCYKNSDAAFGFIEELHQQIPDPVLLVLGNESEIEVSAPYKDKIIPIGFPDDEELGQIMKRVKAGVSFSLWEGFNLFLAEMQWMKRPAVVLNIGAHPEVVVDPWFLADDVAGMAQKIAILLRDGKAAAAIGAEAYQKFRKNFDWHSVIDRYAEILELVMAGKRDIRIIVDVTNASKDPANSGVIRVTRRLCRELQWFVDPLFVTWDEERFCYVLLNEQEYCILGSYNGPIRNANGICSPQGSRISLDAIIDRFTEKPVWILFAETIREQIAAEVREFANKHGIRQAAIFYDAIPVLHPELCQDTAIRENHAHYMRGLAHVDVVIPISDFSGECLKDFWKQQGLKPSARVCTNLLPGEFGGARRVVHVNRSFPAKKTLLCVSTLEPRKNHRRLIEAALAVNRLHLDSEWELVLIGNRYAGGDDVAEFVAQATEEYANIRWLGVVDDETLKRYYKEAYFTIYASFIEGFGMPVLESIWHGRPCLCHEEGVMAELAADGGCMTTDVRNVEKFAGAIRVLLSDEERVAQLAKEAVDRPIKNWHEYTQQFLSILEKHTDRIGVNSFGNIQAPEWERILYKDCLCSVWQMSHAERLALTALLSRLKPDCCVEIGTYKGGSLSLLSEYASTVFSIDIDPQLPEKLGGFRNVSFLTGPSQTILPLLLEELNRNNMPVDLILVDGDHSSEGVRKDMEIVLDYVPKKALFVVMHDGFNPECRRGMLEVDWSRSPYVHMVDVDFIPGRMIEHGGAGDGELWGGLGLAFLSPVKRPGKLIVEQSAERMFRIMKRQR